VLEPAAAFTRVSVATPQWVLAELQQRVETVGLQAAGAARDRDELRAALSAVLCGVEAAKSGGRNPAAPRAAGPRPVSGAAASASASASAWSGSALGVRERLFGVSDEARRHAVRAAQEERRREVTAAGDAAVQLAARADAANKWLAPAEAVAEHLALQASLVKRAWERRSAASEAATASATTVTAATPGLGAISRALQQGNSDDVAKEATEKPKPKWWSLLKHSAGSDAPEDSEAESLAEWARPTVEVSAAAVEQLVGSGEAILLCQHASGEDAFLAQSALLLLARRIVGEEASRTAPAAPAAPMAELEAGIERALSGLRADAPEFRLDAEDTPSIPAPAEVIPAVAPDGKSVDPGGDAIAAMACVALGPDPWQRRAAAPMAAAHACPEMCEDGSLALPVVEVELCSAGGSCRDDGSGTSLAWHLPPDAPFSLVGCRAADLWGPSADLGAELSRMAFAEPWMAWAVWDTKRRDWSRTKRRDVVKRTRLREDAHAAAVEEAERVRMTAVLEEAGWVQAAAESETAARLGTGFPALSPSISPSTPAAAAASTVPELALASSAEPTAASDPSPLAPTVSAPAAQPSAIVRGVSLGSASRRGAWVSHAATKHAVSGKHHFPTLGRSKSSAHPASSSLPENPPPQADSLAGAADAAAAAGAVGSSKPTVAGGGASASEMAPEGAGVKKQPRKRRGKRSAGIADGLGLLGM
jgi:hypothetical protein